MKRAVLLVAVATLSVSALAGIIDPIPVQGTFEPIGERPRDDEVIYSDLGVSGNYVNVGTTATYTNPVGDDIHATSGGEITSFRMGYHSDSDGTILVNFFDNDAADSVIPPWPPGSPAPLASYLVPVQAGDFLLTVSGLSVVVGPDFWFEMDFSGAYGQTTGIPDAGPAITGDSGGTVGFSHNLFSQTGSLWGFTGGLWADFMLEFSIVPEPTAIGLLALGGVCVLRRR